MAGAPKITPRVRRDLIEAALEARKRAYAPYSRFLVGSALLCADGTIFTGVNVENASYGLCICAERSAVAQAVSQGQRDFLAVAVATAVSPPAAPCGMCRQTLTEFSPNLVVFLTNPDHEVVRIPLKKLFPHAFDSVELAAGRGAHKKRAGRVKK
jgi:cytidine deaminase